MSDDPMKLHNVIVTFDVYALAHDATAAREIIIAAIRDATDPLGVSEAVALPVSREREVRAAWRDEKPFAAEDVTDEEFESIKGKTTIEVFKLLYTKPEPEPISTPKKKKDS